MIEFLLFIVALLLSIIFSYLLFIINFLYLFITNFKNLGQWFLNIAISLDQLNNVIGANLMNLALRKKGGYDFGKPDETISSCIGKNKVANTLTTFGKICSNILDFIDNNHSIKSIEEDE